MQHWTDLKGRIVWVYLTILWGWYLKGYCNFSYRLTKPETGQRFKISSNLDITKHFQ